MRFGETHEDSIISRHLVGEQGTTAVIDSRVLADLLNNLILVVLRVDAVPNAVGHRRFKAPRKPEGKRLGVR
jgi:hypothetical protein